MKFQLLMDNKQPLLPASTTGLSPFPISSVQGETKQQSVCQFIQAPDSSPEDRLSDDS